MNLSKNPAPSIYQRKRKRVSIGESSCDPGQGPQPKRVRRGKNKSSELPLAIVEYNYEKENLAPATTTTKPRPRESPRAAQAEYNENRVMNAASGFITHDEMSLAGLDYVQRCTIFVLRLHELRTMLPMVAAREADAAPNLTPALDYVDRLIYLFNFHGDELEARLSMPLMIVVSEIRMQETVKGFDAVVQQGYHIYMNMRRMSSLL